MDEPGSTARARRVRWRRGLRLCGAALLDAVAPPHCPACGGPRGGAGRALCVRCHDELEPMPWRGCRRCGELLAPGPGGGRCVADHAPLRGLAARRAAWRYRRSGGALVRAYKFGRDPGARRLLVAGMTARSGGLGVAPRRALFVAVPMHRRKRRARGFDHAAELAAEVALGCGGEFAPGVLRRLRPTLAQSDPRVLSRERNVDGAFELRRPRIARGRTVVLVDDVSTSGATARACAATLRTAGVRSVALLVGALG